MRSERPGEEKDKEERLLAPTGAKTNAFLLTLNSGALLEFNEKKKKKNKRTKPSRTVVLIPS